MVGRFDNMSDLTGSISVGGSETDHIRIPGLAAELIYLYVSDGRMVVEDATGGVMVDGHLLEGPCFIEPENIVTFDDHTLRITATDLGDVQTYVPPPPDSGFYPPESSHGTSASGDFTGGISKPYEPAETNEHYYQAGAAQVAMDLAYAPGGPAVSRDPLKLVALSGLMAGKEFLLANGKEYDVGRDDEEELEVPLDDPTVSRRHARLRVSEGGVMVLDLRSTNGTFINGHEVKREMATPGDRIRFAEVGFKLANVLPSTQNETKKSTNPRKIIFLVSACVILAGILVSGYALKIRLDRQKDKAKKADQQETLGERQRRQFRETMDRGRKALDSQNWNDAISAFEEALEDYPTTQDRDRSEELLQKARNELQAQKILEEANKTFGSVAGGIDGYERALSLYNRIPAESFYSIEAREKIEALSLRLANLHLTQALTYAKGRRIENRAKAHGFFCSYFEALNSVGRSVVGESKYRKQLENLEKELAKRTSVLKSRNIDFEFCKSPRFLKTPIAVAGKETVDPEEALRKKYEEEAIVGVLMLYFRGQTDPAINRLASLRKKKSLQKQTVLISELHQQLAMIKGKLAEGDGALQRGDIRAADEAYTEAFEVEERLLPDGLVSLTRENVSRRVAERYHSLGESQFKLGRYREAFRYWNRGNHFNPSDTNILNGLVQLEREARRLSRQAQAAPPDQAANTYEMIRDITAVDSPLHKEAIEALSGE